MQGAFRWGIKVAASSAFWRHALWFEAARALLAMSTRRGVLRRPSLDPTYLSWRIATAYGTDDSRVPTDDVVAYLLWRRRQRRTRT